VKVVPFALDIQRDIRGRISLFVLYVYVCVYIYIYIYIYYIYMYEHMSVYVNKRGMHNSTTTIKLLLLLLLIPPPPPRARLFKISGVPKLVLQICLHKIFFQRQLSFLIL
jgi:hypothetical protein